MRYRILGVTQAYDDQGTAVPTGGPRLRALLAALALHAGHVATPETLIDEIWTDDPPQDAPAALQALVGRLRRTLGKSAIASAPGGYRLTTTRDDIDAYVFERLVRDATTALHHNDPATASRTLTEALTLWHGPPLADLPGHPAATRWETLRLDAIRTSAEADLRLGRAQHAVPELTALTAAHPYDERLHALLIRALRDTGRAADAVAAYETARRTLADGLGTDPGPELTALHTELLTSSPQPRQRPEQPAPTGNIRRRLTSFVGREPELEAIRSELHRARLVTLTGPGGSGKTRLAEEAAADNPHAWLVELAPLDRPEAVPGAVVSALGLRETVMMTTELSVPQDDPLALLIEYCAARSRLLVLDNCEHVIGAAADLAETLLTRCPGLTILATSREPLGVPGESVRPVEPLLPDQAHRLFAERAAAVRPDADAVLRDKEAVDEICRRLDGLPLAIELAAARLRLLTPRQIADRLDDRFRLLTSGSRTVLPRQQTLRAVVDWSWDLLDARERTVLREVSVFAGGWDLAAAEAVCTGPAADLVGALVDKSLVVATPYERGDGTDGMRYRMLETIHEYATERAAEDPALRAAAERRHRAWVRELVERADPLLRSAEQLPWISRLETELDNIRAALDRAVTTADEEEAGAIVLAMGWFWWLRNYRREAADWLLRVLRLGTALDAGTVGAADGEPPPLDSVDPVEALLRDPDADAEHPLHVRRMDLRMLHLFMVIDHEQRELARDERFVRYTGLVRAFYEGGGPVAARLPGVCWPTSLFYRDTGTDVHPALDATLVNCRTHGGDWEVAVVLMFRTHMRVDAPGNLAGVDDDLAELRVLSRRVGDRWIWAQVCSAAGEAAMARSRFEEAKGEYDEALRLAYEVGAYAESPFLIARLAEIAFRAGDRDGALAALDEAGAEADRYGVTDSRAFVLLIRATIALHDGDVGQARELCEASRVAAGSGTLPPQFLAGLVTVDALVTAGESGPEHGLPMLSEGFRTAVEQRCSEGVLAAQVDTAAELLARLGDLPRAVRLLAAGERLRGGHPRPMPERADAERVEATARATLPPERWTAERQRGAGLSRDDLPRELAEAVKHHPRPHAEHHPVRPGTRAGSGGTRATGR